MKKILVIGSLNMDYSMEVDSLPKLGETIISKNIELNCGGKGANQAYTIGKLGGIVSMLGCVGNDSSGKKLKESLNSVNVDTSKVLELNDIPTGEAFIFVDNNGDNSIVISQGSNKHITEEVIEQNIDFINSFDIILMQLEIPLTTIKKVLEIAKDKTIILDPAPADSTIMNYDLSNVYLMKPNETELSKLTSITLNNEEDILKATKVLLNKGVKNVLVSLGERGSYLINNQEFIHFDSIKNNVVDTTCAGDSFIGTITLGLSMDKTLKDSIILGTKVSSLVVTKKGAQKSIPSKEEVGL